MWWGGLIVDIPKSVDESKIGAWDFKVTKQLFATQLKCVLGIKANSNITDGTILANVPEGYRPLFMVQENVMVQLGTKKVINAYLEISINGNIIYRGDTLNESDLSIIRANFMYFSNK